MSYRRILTNIDELRKLVEGWREGKKPAEIEMDMALDRVKSIYEQLRFPTEEEVVNVPASEVVTEVAAPVKEVAEEIAAPIEEIAAPTEEAAEPIEETTEPTPEPKPEVTSREAKLHRRKLILALYDNNPQPEVIETEVIEPEITETEAIEPEITVPETTECSLLSQLGINDKILLAQDLTDGDITALESALSAIEAQPTLDDAMIHIAENYSWSGDSDGAKLLITLLQTHYI